MEMKRIRLEVAYDGTNYHGWQIQKNAITIESELNRAISDLFKEEIAVIGASRTDAGVHSRGNIAVFDVDTRIPPEKIAGAINARLPEDIRVVKSDEVPLDWHPRHQDCKKTYEYKIVYGKVQMPTERLYAHFTYRPLDTKKMQEACKFFIGEHDFASLCAAGSQAESTVRTIYDLEVICKNINNCSSKRNGACSISDGKYQEESNTVELCDNPDKTQDNIDSTDLEREIIIRVTGNGFLYNMVRIIAGTLMHVGLGKFEPKDIEGILNSLDRRNAGPTLPAKGLTLIGYVYGDV